MPIRVRIDVNGIDQRTLWIGRLEGGTDSDDINTYAVGEAGPYGLEPWNIVRPEELPQFEHRYGDGLTVCVEKALKRWNEEENRD
jgi:hypothetical protein